MAKKVAAVKKAAGVKLLWCSCVSSYQDTRYGKQQRIHNHTSKGYRCTVCAKEKL